MARIGERRIVARVVPDRPFVGRRAMKRHRYALRATVPCNAQCNQSAIFSGLSDFVRRRRDRRSEFRQMIESRDDVGGPHDRVDSVIEQSIDVHERSRTNEKTTVEFRREGPQEISERLRLGLVTECDATACCSQRDRRSKRMGSPSWPSVLPGTSDTLCVVLTVARFVRMIASS